MGKQASQAVAVAKVERNNLSNSTMQLQLPEKRCQLHNEEQLHHLFSSASDSQTCFPFPPKENSPPAQEEIMTIAYRYSDCNQGQCQKPLM